MRSRRIGKSLLLAAAASALCGAAERTYAATYNWSVTPGEWTTPTNWGASSASYPQLAGDVANMVRNIPATGNVTLSASVLVGTLSVGDNALSGGSWNRYNFVAGNTITFDDGNTATTDAKLNFFSGGGNDSIATAIALAAGENLTISISAATNPTLSGSISGAGTITLNGGTGVLSMTGSGTNFTGAFAVASGTLKAATPFTTANNYNIAGNTVAVGSAGIWDATSSAMVSGIADLDGAGGTITSSNAAAITITLAGSQNHAYSGVITDSGITPAAVSIRKVGSGTQTLTGSSTFLGTTNVSAGTLTVTKLANGGAASSIGKSDNTAVNLLLTGGTLEYKGGAADIDRLFSVGNTGGTLAASGSGALTLSNSGAVVSREAVVTGTTANNSNVVTLLPFLADIVVGARVTGSGIQANTTVSAIDLTSGQVTLSRTPTGNGSRTLTFFANRTLTLSGTNTGTNTLAGSLSNSANGSVLSLAKTGAGRWVLSNGNTYTGITTVSEGILQVIGSGTLGTSATADVSVANGATLVLGNNTGGISLGIDNAADLILSTGSHVALDFTGTETVAALRIDGSAVSAGVYSSSSTFNGNSYFTGTGTLTVLPEPAQVGAMCMGIMSLLSRRRRRAM